MWVETQATAQSSFQKLNADISCQKTRKIRYYIFEFLSNFTVFLYFEPNILPGIVGLKFLSKRSTKFGFFEFFKQFGATFKGESANVSKNRLRIGLLVAILKSPIRINFSWLFEGLRIMVSRLKVKWVSLRLGGLYIPATRILLLRSIIFIVRNSMSEGFSIFMVRLGN